MNHSIVRGSRLLFLFSILLLTATVGWGIWASLTVPRQASHTSNALADESFESILSAGKREMDVHRFELARPLLETAAQKNSGHEEAQTLLAVCYYNLRDYTRSKSVYEKLLREHPGQAPLSNGLGNVLRDMKDIAGAEAQYRAAIAADPEFIVAYSNLAYMLREGGKINEARSVISQGLVKNPNNETLENVKMILQ